MPVAYAVVEVAKAEVEAAKASQRAEAMVDKYKADTSRWDSEVARLDREVKRGVVDPQVLLESQNQHRQSKAMWTAADATVLGLRQTCWLPKTRWRGIVVDVAVAKARVDVSESDAKRMDAWVGYLTIPAPYDGVIVVRNADDWDFVLPASGDPSADRIRPASHPVQRPHRFMSWIAPTSFASLSIFPKGMPTM